MTHEQLIQQIRTKKTFLCVGLDPDLKKNTRTSFANGRSYF